MASKPDSGDHGVVYSRTDRALVLAAADEVVLEELWKAFESGNIDKENNRAFHPGFLQIPAGTEVEILRRNRKGALYVRPLPPGTQGAAYWILPDNLQIGAPPPAAELLRPGGDGEASYE